MKTKPNIKKLPTNEVFYVTAADLADKIIVFMQQGVDPLLLSTSTRACPNKSKPSNQLRGSIDHPVGAQR
jgi:hypothetical protein